VVANSFLSLSALRRRVNCSNEGSASPEAGLPPGTRPSPASQGCGARTGGVRRSAGVAQRLSHRGSVSHFRQNATVTALSRFQAKERQQSTAGGGGVASAWRRRDRHGQRVAMGWSSRCEQQLAARWGRVSLFRADSAEKPGLEGRALRFNVSQAIRLRKWTTFERFAASLRQAGYVSTFRGGLAAARGGRLL
jgi:hypothetical protein